MAAATVHPNFAGQPDGQRVAQRPWPPVPWCYAPGTAPGRFDLDSRGME